MTDTSPGVEELFSEAMTLLASGVTVVTGRKEDGEPRGLVATSICSYSSRPPSLLVSIDHASRSHEVIAGGRTFGVHLLTAEQGAIATVFAGRGEEKFGGLDWSWDEDVPRLDGCLAYLRCRRSARFEHGDHSIVIGDIAGGQLSEAAEPLLYLKRKMGWRLQALE